MAVKTYRVQSTTTGNTGDIIESDQTAATRADGWTVAKIAAANSAHFDAGTKQASGTFSLQSSTPKPSSFVTGALSNAFGTLTPLTGQFANTAWTFTFAVRATTASAQAGRMRMRVFKSVNADGTSATELTGSTQVGTTSSALSTSADVTSVVTWSPGTTIQLDNEYLFFVLAWEITTASGSNSGDVQIRTGQAAAGSRLVTPDFVVPTPISIGKRAAATTVRGVALPAQIAIGKAGAGTTSVGPAYDTAPTQTGVQQVWNNPGNASAADGLNAGISLTVGSISNFLVFDSLKTAGAGGTLGPAYDSAPTQGATAATDWVNLGNAAAADGNFATVTYAGAAFETLTFDNFGFSLPVGAVVTDVTVEAYVGGTSGNLSITPNAAGAIPQSPSIVPAMTLLTASGLWGKSSWTKAEIDGLSLAVAVNGIGTISLDYLRVTVSYMMPVPVTIPVGAVVSDVKVEVWGYAGVTDVTLQAVPTGITPTIPQSISIMPVGAPSMMTLSGLWGHPNWTKTDVENVGFQFQVSNLAASAVTVDYLRVTFSYSVPSTVVRGITISEVTGDTLPIGRKTSATAVYGISLAPAGDAPITIGRKASATAVKGISLAPVGAAPVAVGRVVAFGPSEQIWATGVYPGSGGLGPNEIGTRFTVTADGVIDAIRYFHNNQQGHPVDLTIWRNSDGAKLFTFTDTNPDYGGTQQREVALPTPFPVSAGQTYIVSYGNWYQYGADWGVPPPTTANLKSTAGVYNPTLGSKPATNDGHSYYVSPVYRPLAPPKVYGITVSLGPTLLAIGKAGVPIAASMATGQTGNSGIVFTARTPGAAGNSIKVYMIDQGTGGGPYVNGGGAPAGFLNLWFGGSPVIADDLINFTNGQSSTAVNAARAPGQDGSGRPQTWNYPNGINLAGGQDAGAVVRGISLTPTGAVPISVGRKASATTVKGISVAPTGAAPISIGRKASSTTVNGISLAPTGAVPVGVGKRASATVVRGATLAPVGAAPVTVGKKISATIARGITLAPTGAVPISVGRVSSATAVRGVTPIVPLVMQVGYVPSFGSYGSGGYGELPYGGQQVYGITFLVIAAFAIGSRAAATSVKGITLAPGPVAIPIGCKAAISTVRGISLVPAPVAVPVGKRVAATSVKGVTLVPGPVLLPVGTRAAVTTVRGVTLAPIGAVPISIGRRASATTTRGISLVGAAAFIPIGKVGGVVTTTLGYDVQGASFDSMGSGRMLCSRFTLATAGTLSELHGWFHDGGGASTIRLVIYRHVSGGSPIPTATLVTYSNLILISGGASVHLSQAGFNVALAAGDYWIGARSDVAGGLYRGTITGGGNLGIDSGASDPPPDPFGSGASQSSSTRLLSIWAYVSVPSTVVRGISVAPTGAAPISVGKRTAATNVRGITFVGQAVPVPLAVTLAVGATMAVVKKLPRAIPSSVTLTPAQALVKKAPRVNAATLTLTPAVQRKITDVLAASLVLSPAQVAKKVLYRPLAVTLNFTGAVLFVKKAPSVIVATLVLTPVQSLRQFRKISFPLTLNLTNLMQSGKLKYQSLVATLTLTGLMTKASGNYKTLAATLNLTPTMARFVQAKRVFSVSLSLAPTMVKKSIYSYALSLPLISVFVKSKKNYQTLSAVLSHSALLGKVRLAPRAFVASVALSAALTKVLKAPRTFNVGLNVVPGLNRVLKAYRRMDTTVTLTLEFLRPLKKLLPVNLPFTSTIRKGKAVTPIAFPATVNLKAEIKVEKRTIGGMLLSGMLAIANLLSSKSESVMLSTNSRATASSAASDTQLTSATLGASNLDSAD